jgi:thiosulfate/3-mercaptopyruvate sulfurtransferase
MFPAAEQFGRDVGALGIGNGDTVVLYDSGGWVAAPRAWWMFLSFGHRDVRVVDGGLKKWRAEGRPVESGAVTAKPAVFKAATMHGGSARSSR